MENNEVRSTIVWHPYNRDDPSTYPEARGRYLLTVEYYSKALNRINHMVTVSNWVGSYKFDACEQDRSRVTYWAKAEPCMEGVKNG